MVYFSIRPIEIEMSNKTYLSKNENETLQIAREFSKELKAGDVVFLSGDLGAGKTIFTKGVAAALGINSRILSPTFSILRSHHTKNHPTIKSLHHLDLYRVKPKESEIEEALDELLTEKDSVIFIEWPSNLSVNATWEINFSNKTPKEITITKTNEIKKGEIVIFPTDTAFGIGCRIDDGKTIEKLFRIRKRPQDKAMPVLVSSQVMAKKYGEIDLNVEKILKKFWPGGLTVIVKANKEKVQSLVRGGGDTIGLRMPDHKNTLKMIENTGVPILGSSANFSGGTTPYKFEDLDKDLLSLVDRVIKGETKHKIASTVLDTTKNPWQILRVGAVTKSELNVFIPNT